jgi:hypothetical protein
MSPQSLKAVFIKQDTPKERETLLESLVEVIKDNPAIKTASGEYTLTLSLEELKKPIN